jgi:hypothetical protein
MRHTFSCYHCLVKKYFADFCLVGGTSLSLRYGHRKSIDIDLFSPKQFDPSILEELLKAGYPENVYRGNNNYMLFCHIGSVKCDFVYRPFALLSPVETIDKIRMFSIQDVAAMKLFAICKRGTRKVFYDLWALLQNFTPNMLVEFFIEKYGVEKLIFLKKNIIYFEEADDSEQPEILIKDLDWEKIKKIVYKTFISL